MATEPTIACASDPLSQDPNALPKTYDPREIEAKWYPRWMEQRLFEAKDDP